MEKMRSIWIVCLISFMLALSIVAAQATNPWSASQTGAEKNTFTSLDDVYVKSNVLCEPAEEVDVYIVESNDGWEDGDNLDDVRGLPEPVVLVNSKIPLTKLWEVPVSGEYDIVVDCNRNEEYDEFIDDIDSFSGVGFSVESVAGVGKAKKGSEDVGNHVWRYDPEEIDFTNEMLQIALTAEGEDIELFNLTLVAFGNGDDSQVSAVEVYVDENNNGRLDDTEILIGDVQPGFEDDNGMTLVELDYFLINKETENILIVYILDETVLEGEFSLIVKSIEGVGSDSDSPIKFSGVPITSGKKQVLPEKTCLGELTLELKPNPVDPDGKVIATFSGLEGCDGMEVALRTNPCGSTSPRFIDSCVLENDSCKVSFKATSSLTYYACVDKSEDGDSVDFGEFAFEDLEISLPEGKEIEENIEEDEEEIEENIEEGTLEEITGKVTEVGEEISETSSFFILLEVTLLLILFVLVMILFRLKPVVVQPEKTKNSKKEKVEKIEKSE